MRKRASLLALLSGGLIYASSTNSPPTFSRDIAPILYANCVTCHRPGGPGPFSLIQYSDAKRHAGQIASVTQSGYMPPWPAEAPPGTFKDERRLTREEVRALTEWAKADAPEGVVSEQPRPPAYPDGWQLGSPDIVLDATRELTLPSSGSDVFWNFTFRTNLKDLKYVRAIEIRPGNPKVVHHANLLVDRTRSVEHLERTPGAGFPGMDVDVSRNPLDPESHFLFWKPGTLPYSEPEGLSWRLDPGNILVLNTHLQPSGKPEKILPSIGIYFTDRPPTRFPLLIQLERDRLLHIPAGAKDFVVRDEFRMPVDVDVLAIYPHAHYLGTLQDVYATLPGGERRALIRIPHWDLNWQAVYRYSQPLFLPAGSLITMEFHYDNSSGNPRNPNSPPELVNAGNQVIDEMGHLWLQLLPRGNGDRRRPIQEALMRHRLDLDPDNFSAHLNLGAILLSRLKAQEAVTELRAAAQLDPTRADAHDMLGAALQNTGLLNEAIEQFRIAIHAQPNYMSARYNLALALLKTGRLAEALSQLEKVAAAYPDSARLQDQYRSLLAQVQKDQAR